MKKNRGFSLLELLIVVAIILIIATIAIPSLLRSRQAAQESSAVAQIRTVNTAEVTYLSSNGGNYGSIPELIRRVCWTTVLPVRFPATRFPYRRRAATTLLPRLHSTNAGRFGYMSLPDAVVRYQTATSTTCNPCFPTGQSGSPVQ